MIKQGKPIKLVQITDPHLYADTSEGLYGVNTYQSFETVIAEVAKHEIDLVLLTGDLVQDETEQGYKHLRQCLQTLDVPTQLIPGNHDDFVFMQKEFATGQINCEKTIVLGGWQILMLNSQLPGQVAGHLSDKELKWLERSLNQTDAPFSIVFLHHNPVPMGCKWLDPLGLDNADRLFELIAAHPQVKAVAWGHVHQAFSEERAGVQLLSTPSTCVQFRPGVNEFELDYLPPGYRWFRLFEDGSLETGIKRLGNIPDGLDPKAKGYGV